MSIFGDKMTIFYLHISKICSNFAPQSLFRPLKHKHTMAKKKKTYRTSELPAEVRTREQVDHDAWEEAVRNGEIPTWHN